MYWFVWYRARTASVLKITNTRHLSLSSPGGTEALGGAHFPKAFRAPTRLSSLQKASSSPLGIGASFLLSGTMMSEQENTVHIPLQDSHHFRGPAQSENAGPFIKHYYEFQDGTPFKQGPF